MADLAALTRRYLEALERHDGSALAFYASDAEQVELPNRLNPAGATHDVAAMRAANERGRKVMRAERYDVRTIVASDDCVAVEMLWTGTLAVPFGSIPAGGEMRAHLAMFLRFRDGAIVEQRNYDCFEPF